MVYLLLCYLIYAMLVEDYFVLFVSFRMVLRVSLCLFAIFVWVVFVDLRVITLVLLGIWLVLFLRFRLFVLILPFFLHSFWFWLLVFLGWVLTERLLCVYVV